MKMKFGALVVDGRGKIGGHVASKNRGGAYLRTKVTPLNRNSPAQLSARSRLTVIAQGWRGLTIAQIAAWNNAVNSFKSTNVFGDIKTPTGSNLYQKLNNNLLQINEALITAPPVIEAIPLLESATVTIVAGDSVELNFAPTPSPAGLCMLVDMTPGLSTGISFVKSEYRRITFVSPATATGFDFTTEYENVFGSIPPIGTKVFTRVKYVDELTGITGAYTYSVFHVVA